MQVLHIVSREILVPSLLALFKAVESFAQPAVPWQPECVLLGQEDYELLCLMEPFLPFSTEDYRGRLTLWIPPRPQSLLDCTGSRLIPLGTLPDLPRKPRFADAHWSFEQAGYAALPTPRRSEVFFLCAHKSGKKEV